MRYILDCISDTHTKHHDLVFPDPHQEENFEDIWILVHAGDFTHHGQKHEAESFNHWLNQQPHYYKVVTCGNHELLMDKPHYDASPEFRSFLASKGLSLTPTSIINGTNVFYLEETGINIEGLNIWGSPYSPRFFDWGFQTDPHTANAHWDKIQKGTDVIIAHGPPKYHGDKCPDMHDRSKQVFVGCPVLLDKAREINPSLVVSGHIHEGFGIYHDVEDKYDGLYVNASVLDGAYNKHGSFVRVVIEDGVATATIMRFV